MKATYDRRGAMPCTCMWHSTAVRFARTEMLTSNVMVNLNAAEDLVGVEILRVGVTPRSGSGG